MRMAAIQCVLVLVLLQGCDGAGRGGSNSNGRDPTGPSDVLNVDGFYRLTQTNAIPSCAPSALPAPLPGEDPDDFAMIGPFAANIMMEIEQNGARIEWIPREIDGRPASEVALLGEPLDGKIDEQDNVMFDNQHVFRESLREDSVNYQVTLELDLTVLFAERGGTVEVEGTGISKYIYRPAPSEPIFTTCTVPMMTSGVRDSIRPPVEQGGVHTGGGE